MKKTFPLIIVLSILLIAPSLWAALFGSLPNEVAVWADANGMTGSTVTKGTTGCLKGKRYVQMTAPGVKGYAVFFHPIYSEETAVVSQIIFEFSPPVSIGKARSYAIKQAPIIGTRAPTHKQKIKPEKGNACIPASGGFEERYTKDWLVEFFKGPGGKGIGKMTIYNDYLR